MPEIKCVVFANRKWLPIINDYNYEIVIFYVKIGFGVPKVIGIYMGLGIRRVLNVIKCLDESLFKAS